MHILSNFCHKYLPACSPFLANFLPTQDRFRSLSSDTKTHFDHLPSRPSPPLFVPFSSSFLPSLRHCVPRGHPFWLSSDVSVSSLSHPLLPATNGRQTRKYISPPFSACISVPSLRCLGWTDKIRVGPVLAVALAMMGPAFCRARGVGLAGSSACCPPPGVIMTALGS